MVTRRGPLRVRGRSRRYRRPNRVHRRYRTGRAAASRAIALRLQAIRGRGRLNPYMNQAHSIWRQRYLRLGLTAIPKWRRWRRSQR